MKAAALSLSLLAVLGVAETRPDPRHLPGARVTADPRKGELVIELAPVDLPARAGHHVAGQPPVLSGALSAIRSPGLNAGALWGTLP